MRATRVRFSIAEPAHRRFSTVRPDETLESLATHGAPDAMFAQMGNRALPRAASSLLRPLRHQAARAVAPAALPLHRTELRRRVTVSAKKPKAAEPEPVPEPEDEEVSRIKCSWVAVGGCLRALPAPRALTPLLSSTMMMKASSPALWW
jgi:hypothetical protein